MQIGSNPISTFNYTGPNQTQVAADNAQAVADGFNGGGFSLSDILTANDKQLTGYQPGAPINQAAIALASYRFNGSVTGEVTSQFVDAIKNSIATSGGYPMNPNSLMQPNGTSSSLSPDTLGSVLSILSTPQSSSSNSTGA